MFVGVIMMREAIRILRPGTKQSPRPLAGPDFQVEHDPRPQYRRSCYLFVSSVDNVDLRGPMAQHRECFVLVQAT